MARKKKCAVPGCGDEVRYKKAGLCNACYMGMHYWTGRTPTDIMHRQWQLDRLQSRMELISRRGKVVRLRRRA